jgi:hypothetical protein
MFRKRVCWVPTTRTVLLSAVLVIATVALMVRSANSFLSVNRPVQAQILVVEGWLPDYAMRDAAAEFNRGEYRWLLTAGESDPELAKWSHFTNWADHAAAELSKLHVDAVKIIAVPSAYTSRDRTFSSAMAVKDWLAHQPQIKTANVYTLGSHGRRTRLLYEKAFGSSIKIGVISHEDTAYDAKHWWATSEGTRIVGSEAIAYLYARLVFPFLSGQSGETDNSSRSPEAGDNLLSKAHLSNTL